MISLQLKDVEAHKFNPVSLKSKLQENMQTRFKYVKKDKAVQTMVNIHASHNTSMFSNTKYVIHVQLSTEQMTTAPFCSI